MNVPCTSDPLLNSDQAVAAVPLENAATPTPDNNTMTGAPIAHTSALGTRDTSASVAELTSQASADSMSGGVNTPSSKTLASAIVPAPPQPANLMDAGLSLTFVADMILKLLYVHGVTLGQDIAHHLRLHFAVVDEPLRFLKDQRLVEVSGGDILGRVSYRFSLTEFGRHRAREVFEQCRYVGPAPVPLDQYVMQVKRQGVQGINCQPALLEKAYRGLVVTPELLSELGPAICSGRAIFLYGNPGNGKTVIAKGLGRFLNSYGGDIYVPYALLVENSIITVFDPVVHEPTDEEAARPQAFRTWDRTNPGSWETTIDRRWRRIRRPLIITGGELTLDMLELRYNRTSNYYAAPLHIKANGGVFLIDDFGRQLVGTRELLNRWIIPLEERVDYLTLATGRKFPLPCEQLIIFSTNLNPRDLVDDAFLRRIRHKIRVPPPNRAIFSRIFDAVCRERGFSNPIDVVEHLFSKYYSTGRAPRSSDPRDLHDLAQALCDYHGWPRVWSPALLEQAALRLFHEVSI